MVRNPWLSLPDAPPFVLADDKRAIEAFNQKAKKPYFIQTNMLPEPFVGSLNAPVFILQLNPGAGGGEEDFALHRQPEFQRRVRACHHQLPSQFPHYFLDPDTEGPGAQWTRQKLKPLIEAFGIRVVASGVCVLEYFPYHSKNFAHARLSVPSQTFTFEALRAAVGRGATIIIVRGRKLWEKAVPELSAHALVFETSSKQNVVISPKNCRFDALPFYKGKQPAEPPHARPSGYTAVAAALGRLSLQGSGDKVTFPTRNTIVEMVARDMYGARILNNAHRGDIVEMMVLAALGSDWKHVGLGWHPWDLQRGIGTYRRRIQVKQTAAVQLWGDTKRRVLTFGWHANPPSYFEKYNPGETIESEGWFCELIVYGIHDEKDPTLIDQADPRQWRFMVIPTRELKSGAKTMLLERAESRWMAVGWRDLRGKVEGSIES